MRKELLVLFGLVFCIGDTYSSPAKKDTSEIVLAVAAQQTNHIIEPTTSIPVSGHVNETPAVKTSSDHGESDSKSSVTESTIDKKIINQDSNKKNNTFVTPPADSMNSSTVAYSNASLTIDNKTFSTVTYNTKSNLVLNNISETHPFTTVPNTSPVKIPGAGITAEPLATQPTAVTSTVSTSKIIVMEHSSSPENQQNHFDGASFVGGIVLTIGLTAIGFIAFKYYKSGKIDGTTEHCKTMLIKCGM